MVLPRNSLRSLHDWREKIDAEILRKPFCQVGERADIVKVVSGVVPLYQFRLARMELLPHHHPQLFGKPFRATVSITSQKRSSSFSVV